jgi:hypothetical protein
MKLNKIFILAALSVVGLGFASCDDDDDYEAGKQAGSYNVTFDSQANQILAKTATSFDVELNRHSTSGTLTVPIEKVNVPAAFTVPESVTFAEGDSIATLKVQVADTMTLNTGYDFTIQVPEEYTNPYKDQSSVAMYKVTITKEDYETAYTATFTSGFFEGSWPVTIERSPSLGILRIKDLYVEGYNYYLKWDGSSKDVSLVTSTGATATSVRTGYVHKKYGMVSTAADPDEGAFGYDASTKTIYLTFNFTVSAGSFGAYTETLTDITAAK